MTIMPLYTSDTASLSPRKDGSAVESDYVRLVADAGYAITDGEVVVCVIDVHKDDASRWNDCPPIPVPPTPEPEPTAEEVVDILLGVEE